VREIVDTEPANVLNAPSPSASESGSSLVPTLSLAAAAAHHTWYTTQYLVWSRERSALVAQWRLALQHLQTRRRERELQSEQEKMAQQKRRSLFGGAERCVLCAVCCVVCKDH
jgi:hypothetical protein